jgi:hypothetical protein
MTACHVEPRVSTSACGALRRRTAERLHIHRRLTTAIGSRSHEQYRRVGPWAFPIVTGPLAIIGVGCLWGSIIGFALGGAVGAVFLLIGAIYGAPIGAIVGLIVAVPAPIVLATVLLLLDRPPTDGERLVKDTATTLAVLIELLATSVLGAATIAVLAGGDPSDLRPVAAAVIPVIVLSAAAAWLLGFAARHLVRTWARAWGWEVIR